MKLDCPRVNRNRSSLKRFVSDKLAELARFFVVRSAEWGRNLADGAIFGGLWV